MNKQPIKWTVTDVSDRFEDAVFTLKRLPNARIQSYGNTWPTVVRSTVEILQGDVLPMRLGPPSSKSISEMEECFQWILWLDDETERRIVWLRAQRVYWKQICWRVGYGRTKAWHIYTVALLKIATRLNTNVRGR